MDSGGVVWLPGGGLSGADEACQEAYPGTNVCAEWEGDGGWYVWCCPY